MNTVPSHYQLLLGDPTITYTAATLRDPGPGRGVSTLVTTVSVPPRLRSYIAHAPLQWSRVDNGSRGHAAAAPETFALKYFKTRSRDLLCRLGMIDREQVNVAHIFWYRFCVDI